MENHGWLEEGISIHDLVICFEKWPVMQRMQKKFLLMHGGCKTIIMILKTLHDNLVSAVEILHQYAYCYNARVWSVCMSGGVAGSQEV